MIELYEFPPTRSQRAKWVLEELGAPYESRLVNLPDGDQNTDAYRKLQPLAAVPAIKSDRYAMFESVAIVLQLIDEHPEKGLAPPPGTPERAVYYQWCVFAGTEIDPAVMMYFDNTMRPLEGMRPPGTLHDKTLAERGRRDFTLRAQIVSDAMGDQPYLLGDRFTGADILIGHSCFMAALTGLIGGFPVLQDYFERLQRRDGYRRAYEEIDLMAWRGETE